MFDQEKPFFNFFGFMIKPTTPEYAICITSRTADQLYRYESLKTAVHC